MTRTTGRLRLKCDGTRAETRFRLSAKGTSPFRSAESSVQSTTDSRGVHISGSNAGYTMFRGSVKSTSYPLHSPVSLHFPSHASPCAITFQLDPKRNCNKQSKATCQERKGTDSCCSSISRPEQLANCEGRNSTISTAA